MILDNPSIRHVHCIGIGGIGVSGIAEWLIQKGYHVTGSDPAHSAQTQRLAQLGAHIYADHAASHIDAADAVIFSSAIHPDNPEFEAAKARGMPMIRRGEMLAELMAQGKGVAVAGTHGKTTTTAMLAHILLSSGRDVTTLIGGVLNGAQSPVHVGTDEWVVVEADESDASFLHLSPDVAVITNVDRDHLSTYNGDFQFLQKTFLDFLNQLPQTGLAVLCLDDDTIEALLPALTCRVKTYGTSPQADMMLADFRQTELTSQFVVRFQSGETASFTLSAPGQHNALNAMAAVGVALDLGVSLADCQAALACFPGVGRRFHCHGAIKTKNAGTALLFDDYGHHPCEIKATISAARAAWPDRRLVWIFQPHRYSRTQALMLEFVEALQAVDQLILLDVYGAGEAPISGVDAPHLAHAIEDISQKKPIYQADVAALPQTLSRVLQDQDIVLCQGAGTIGTLAVELADAMRV